MRKIKQKITKAACFALALGLFAGPIQAMKSPDKASSSTQNTEQVNEFIQSMVEKHQFDANYLNELLQHAKPNQQILNAINKPWESKPWHQYHPIFLTEKRVNRGVEFWETHHESLIKAEKELGIPAEIIVAIIGVETYYGTYKGKYSVLDALYTLGFYHPPRAKFFKKELEEFFVLAREEQFDVSNLKGSYAGAMGLGQFISSSYRHYAIDFDGDGVRDLLTNPVDAIGSVANYFRKHGWKTGEPVTFPAQVNGNNFDDLISKDLKLKHSWQELQNKGVIFTDKNALTVADTSKVKLLEFEQETGKEYWVGLHNFYVITRYNHSPLYAMAVYQLSQQIKAKKMQEQVQQS